MAKNLSRKILEAHLAKPSEMIPGEEIYLKVDQTLTHDINAVMTYLAFEQIGLDRTQVETSVSYLDHNLLYLDYKTPDDHIYLQSVYGWRQPHASRRFHWNDVYWCRWNGCCNSYDGGADAAENAADYSCKSHWKAEGGVQCQGCDFGNAAPQYGERRTGKNL